MPGQNRVCQKCTSTCPDGGRVIRRCSYERDTLCTTHVKCSCGDDEYISRECDLLYGYDARCSKVTSWKCKDGFYMVANATKTSDIRCEMCPSVCPFGQYQKSPATSIKLKGCPFECANCTSCPKGKRQTRACNATHNAECGDCIACSGGTYMIETCWGLQGTACRTCLSAPAGMYTPPSNYCDGMNNSIAVPCLYHVGDPDRACPVGSIIKSICKDPYTDRDTSR